MSQVDLSQLPKSVPDVRLGDPLPKELKERLPEEIRSALTQLFRLADMALDEPRALDRTTYEALQRAYQRVTELGLTRYCPVIQIGVTFELDESAVRTAAHIVAMGDTHDCFACH